MDVLLRQTRVRFSGLTQETTNKEETNSNSNRERRIPPQKTQSFKGEKKRSQNWFSRQFSRDMSQDDYDGDDDHEYAMAVAATAFAINSSMKELTINNTDDQRKPRERQQDSIIRTSQPANKVSRQKSGILGDFSRSDTKEPTRNVGQTPSIKKSSTFQDKKLPDVQSPKFESENLKPNSPFGKQLTFPDKNNPASANHQPTKQLSFRTIGSTRAKSEETEADKWEKAEMIKIKERYASMKTTILDWENKKKGKAKNKKERIESELERKRSKAMQKYREEIDRIEKIAGGARAQADENERYEKSKVKNKANKIRETGKLPATCLCF